MCNEYDYMERQVDDLRGIVNKQAIRIAALEMALRKMTRDTEGTIR